MKEFLDKLSRSFFWKYFFKHQILCRLFPRQRWLTKQIPKTWIDKDRLFEICILESIKHYVEKECCFDVLCWDNPPAQAQFLRETKNRYNDITIKLKNLQKQLEEEWDKIPAETWETINNGDKEEYKRRYGKIDKLEQEIYNLTTDIMIWAIYNRNQMWT